MSTPSITHRPSSFLAAAAVVAAVGAGAVALTVSQHADPAAPSGQTQTSVRPTPPQPSQVPGTTAGGHVMIGE